VVSFGLLQPGATDGSRMVAPTTRLWLFFVRDFVLILFSSIAVCSTLLISSVVSDSCHARAPRWSQFFRKLS
jgi:hypothetical protein